MMKKTLTTLLVLGLFAAVPGTALAADHNFDVDVRPDYKILPADSNNSCPPNVKTCVDNAVVFTCRAAERMLPNAFWLIEAVTGDDPRDPGMFSFNCDSN